MAGRADAPEGHLTADSAWRSSDGCNGTAGTWVAGADGGFLSTTTGLTTLVGCAGVRVDTQVGTARRAAFEGTTLVLLDADAQPTGRFVRS